LWANLVLHLHLVLPVVRALVMDVSLLQGVEMVLFSRETYATGAASGNGTYGRHLWRGSVSASNIFRKAGGLGSGSTAGSTIGGGLTVKGIGISGTRTSTAISNTVGSGSLLSYLNMNAFTI
jgi:hypothetical protein